MECTLRLTEQIVFLLEIDEAKWVWSQTKDSPAENSKILKHAGSKMCKSWKNMIYLVWEDLRVNGLLLESVAKKRAAERFNYFWVWDEGEKMNQLSYSEPSDSTLDKSF